MAGAKVRTDQHDQRMMGHAPLHKGRLTASDDCIVHDGQLPMKGGLLCAATDRHFLSDDCTMQSGGCIGSCVGRTWRTSGHRTSYEYVARSGPARGFCAAALEHAPEALQL